MTPAVCGSTDCAPISEKKVTCIRSIFRNKDKDVKKTVREKLVHIPRARNREREESREQGLKGRKDSEVGEKAFV